MSKPKLLDLFCGAGGAAMGYHRAGFDIVGVDNQPQPRYPFEFIQGDALEYVAEHGQEYDVIHASPPCQAYSIMNNLPWLKDREYPQLILPTRQLLEETGKPYVIENVMGAKYRAKGLKQRGLEAHGLEAGWLCGTMFGLPFYRHRLFATNWFWLAPGHPTHTFRQGMPGSPQPRGSWEERRKSFKHRHKEDGDMMNGSLARWQGNGAQAYGVGIGHAAGWRLAAEKMEIDWMKQKELTQAIPPAYTEHIGKALMQQLPDG